MDDVYRPMFGFGAVQCNATNALLREQSITAGGGKTFTSRGKRKNGRKDRGGMEGRRNERKTCLLSEEGPSNSVT